MPLQHPQIQTGQCRRGNRVSLLGEQPIPALALFGCEGHIQISYSIHTGTPLLPDSHKAVQIPGITAAINGKRRVSCSSRASFCRINKNPVTASSIPLPLSISLRL
ncbi:hypothetical protein D3C75_1169150 [compost metagenome]